MAKAKKSETADVDEKESKAAPKKRRKAKYIVLYSPFLMKETKHELIGEPIESENGRQQWARCTVCHHSQLINLDALQAAADRALLANVNKEDSVKYSPKSEYQVGDVIYHQTWDDLGIVRSKEVTTTGGFSIVVHFEKNKEKRLIERLA